MPDFDVTIVSSLSQMERSEFDALADHDNPFVEHQFLHALERSESVGASAGWTPAHVIARHCGRLVGVIPAYVKDNSFGEYIFDWSWAQAAHRAQIPYYPKIVCAVPFTPAAGPRLLRLGAYDGARIADALVAGLFALADTVSASSIHVLFCNEAEQQTLVRHYGFLPRLTFQYHWNNRGYLSFDDYLSRLRSPAKKMIRRERRQVEEAGISIEAVSGSDMTTSDWDALYRYYRSTVRQYGAHPYLTKEFFSILRDDSPNHALGIFARRCGTTVAGALYFEKGKHLYGRYWGCSEDIPSLHFELCYYRPIERCIQKGYTLFEAGAQGDHKIKRGLMPSPTYSAHWIRDQNFATAVSRYLEHETAAVHEQMAILSASGPFPRVTAGEL